MIWNFYINDVLVDEPIGFDEMTVNIARDERWHGIFFEAATSTLGFFGTGAQILRSIKNSQGLAATAELRIELVCGQEVDLLVGRLDFGTYQETCNPSCIVNISVEKSGCTMTLRNRYDQKVDLSSNRAFDKTTILTDYPGLNFEMEIPAKELFVGTEGYVEDQDFVDMDTFYTGSGVYAIRPDYFRKINESINNSQLEAIFKVSNTDEAITPQLLLDDIIECFDGGFQYEVRLKGAYDMTITGLAQSISNITTSIGYGEYPSSYTVLHNDVIDASSGVTKSGSFDIFHSGTIALPDGAGFYALFGFVANGTSITGGVTFDSDTYIKITANKSCPPTNATVSLIHETGSRIVEAITDGCMRLKSDYYGRTDSQPFQSTYDGCGSLRILTSGLRLRNAENPTHFMSLQDYFNGLRGIDNIGMGIEPDEMVATREMVRVEPVEYFYQDTEVLRLEGVPNGKFILDSKYGYSLVRIGYTKWEVERVNGLDEYNSTKEFRTSLSTIDNTLDALSHFVAGGYPIEVTRQQSFADTGGADTTFDNETFVICVERGLYGYEVEQGNIIDADNFYSPQTALNWRIRPFYNLMRWWKSIAQSYVNLINTTSKLFFSSGTGNLLAEGELPLYDECKLENSEYSENSDLGRTNFAVENLPIYRPERLTFTYPMSLRDYNLIKANPYGYLSVQCGQGEYVKAYILSILYRPAQGTAEFNLILKW